MVKLKLNGILWNIYFIFNLDNKITKYALKYIWLNSKYTLKIDF